MQNRKKNKQPKLFAIRIDRNFDLNDKSCIFFLLETHSFLRLLFFCCVFLSQYKFIFYSNAHHKFSRKLIFIFFYSTIEIVIERSFVLHIVFFLILIWLLIRFFFLLLDAFFLFGYVIVLNSFDRK